MVLAHSSAHMRVGKEGEEIAERYLRKAGFVLCDRNVRIGRDEIDLIMFDRSQRMFIFIEVKTRSLFSFDYCPELNFTHAKKEKMLRAARAWIAKYQFEGAYRCDLVCVVDGKVADHFSEVSFD